MAYCGQQSLRITVLLLLCMQSLAWSGNRTLLNFARRASPPRRASALVLKCSLSNKGNMNKMDFRVATYNILCSHLAEPTRFPQCSSKNLDAPTRLKRVKHKLDAEVSVLWQNQSSSLPAPRWGEGRISDRLRLCTFDPGTTEWLKDGLNRGRQKA